MPVPAGLITSCSSAVDGGALTVGAPFVQASVPSAGCLLYHFDAQPGDYMVEVISQGGGIRLVASAAADFSVPLGVSFGASMKISAPAAGTDYVALEAPDSAATVRVRVARLLPSLPYAPDCDAVDHGTLTAGAPATDDFAFPGECPVYSFSVDAQTAYKVTYGPTDGQYPELIGVRDGSTVVKELLFPYAQSYPVMGFGADTGGTYQVVMVGLVDSFSSTIVQYSIELDKGTAPPGLIHECVDIVDRGPMPLDFQEYRKTLELLTCDVYTIPAAVGMKLGAYVQAATANTNEASKFAQDSQFENLVATTSEAFDGYLSTDVFVANQATPYYLAVFSDYGQPPLDYLLRGLQTLNPPAGLTCLRAKSGGVLTVDGPEVSDTTLSDECVNYTLDVVSGTPYTVAGVRSGCCGIGIHVAQDAQQLVPIPKAAGSGTYGGFTVVAPVTGTIHVTVEGTSSYFLKVATAAPVPSGLQPGCTFAMDMGPLTLGASPVKGYAPDGDCVLYSFSGTPGTSYGVRIDALNDSRPSARWAGDAAFSTTLNQQARDVDAFVFTPTTTEPQYFAVWKDVGFGGVVFTISAVTNAAAPAPLSSYCQNVFDAGPPLPVGLNTVFPGICNVYSVPVVAGTQYTLNASSYPLTVGMSLATDPGFASILTTETSTTTAPNYVFTAASSQTDWVAIFPLTSQTTTYSLSVF